MSQAESPPRSVARCLLRRFYRSIGALPRVRSAILLFGGYQPKLSALAGLFQRHGSDAIAFFTPDLATMGADAVVELLDSRGWALEYAVPLVDCAVALADCLNARVGRPANDPETAELRRDKFQQQEALRSAGLAAPRQLRTDDADAASSFAQSFLAAKAGVVVKPADASGGDGVWFCSSEEDLRQALACELGKTNIERGSNAELIVTEALIGEEWVVNTVSRDSRHVVTDVWRGPSKRRVRGSAGEQFVYEHQLLELPADGLYREEAQAVLRFALQALDACGVAHGAAHTELVWVPEVGPQLFEINARCAGGLPRIRTLNQLEVLALSVCDADAFLALPGARAGAPVPGARRSRAEDGKAVVFLQAPYDGWLLGEALARFAALETFWRFERGLFEAKPPFANLPVKATVGLFSSPGSVVLSGPEELLLRDLHELRRLEAEAYSATDPAEETKNDTGAV